LFSISIINNLFQVPSSIFLHHQAFFFRLHHQNLSSSHGIIKIFLLQASSSKGLIITNLCFSGWIIINLF